MARDSTSETVDEEVSAMLWLRQDGSDSWESRRYKRVGMMRVADVQADYQYRPNKLYRRDAVEVDPGAVYHKDDIKELNILLGVFSGIRRLFNAE